ncbi:MAG: hypothetical protein PVH26_11230 [Desulfosarcina sp.]|jgi:hypothetical protein
MARIRKCKLSWEASASENVIGYKLYWSMGTEVSYDSKSLKLGNVTEILLPDDVVLSDGPVMFGVTAVDKDGNESDMVTIDEPYQMHVPEAPVVLSIKPSDDFRLVDPAHAPGDKRPMEAAIHTESGDDDDPLAQAIEGEGDSRPAKMKYYDDLGYRQTT